MHRHFDPTAILFGTDWQLIVGDVVEETVSGIKDG
jgi:hypothetical protein